MNTVVYDGIVLELPEKKAQFTHSLVMDMAMGKSSNEHIDWTRKLGDILWGKIKQVYPESFEETSKLYSLLNMNYQICNGGIYQYFDNRYHEEREPYHEHDVAHINQEEQRIAFRELVIFAKELFPDRTEENQKLATACERFQKVWFEEDIEVYETIYSEEDEMIYDEETEAWIKNPAYEEPYELCIGLEYEVREGWHFDDDYYETSNYLEELLELKAQFLYKSLEKQIDMDKNINPEMIAVVNGKELTLEEKIKAAQGEIDSRVSAGIDKEVQIER